MKKSLKKASSINISFHTEEQRGSLREKGWKEVRFNTKNGEITDSEGNYYYPSDEGWKRSPNPTR